MIVYHGSYVEVSKPEILYSRDNVDFGKGFYITPIKEQAVKWAARFKRKKGNGIVSVYEIDLDKIRARGKVQEFAGYTEDWLEYIITCRNMENTEKHDVIIGGVANDKVFNTIELYFDDLIDKKEAIKRLKYEKPNLQICLSRQKLIDNYLKFCGSEEV